jgi:hypothetical protein
LNGIESVRGQGGYDVHQEASGFQQTIKYFADNVSGCIHHIFGEIDECLAGASRGAGNFLHEIEAGIQGIGED